MREREPDATRYIYTNTPVEAKQEEVEVRESARAAYFEILIILASCRYRMKSRLRRVNARYYSRESHAYIPLTNSSSSSSSAVAHYTRPLYERAVKGEKRIFFFARDSSNAAVSARVFTCELLGSFGFSLYTLARARASINNCEWQRGGCTFQCRAFES